jgi:hypothetical protein
VTIEVMAPGRGARADEQRAGHDLSHTGPIGELVCDPGELGARVADGERRGDEHRGDRGERQRG